MMMALGMRDNKRVRLLAYVIGLQQSPLPLHQPTIMLTERSLFEKEKSLNSRCSTCRLSQRGNLSYMHISEKARLQFRGEFLNAFNHAMFGNPNTSPVSTAFGTVTAEIGYPRRIQLGMKLVF